MIRRKKTGI